MHEYAFGVMGLSPLQYYGMTESEYLAQCEGFKRRELGEWERTRIIAYTIHVHNAKDPKRIEEFMPLTKEERSMGLTPEKMMDIWEQHKKKSNGR